MTTDRPIPSPTTSAAPQARRVALYLRAQPNAEPGSLRMQRQALQAYVARGKDVRLVAEFVDRCSCLAHCRPGLKAAVAAAWLGDFDILLVEHLDRIARRSVDARDQVLAFAGAGIEIHSMRDQRSLEPAHLGLIFQALVNMELMYPDLEEHHLRTPTVLPPQRPEHSSHPWVTPTTPRQQPTIGEPHHDK
jgi:hypothetical protein